MTDNLPQNVKYWLSEAKHDCFFLVGPEEGLKERIGALKILLMGFSEPFRAMLQDSELAETGDVRLIDIEPETFWNFLKCIYGGSKIVIPGLSFDESVKLFYVIDKYLVENLKYEIENHLVEIWSPKNLFITLSNVVCLNVNRLKREMRKVLKIGFLEISMAEEFLNLDYAAIMWILKLEKLNVKEFEIWSAVLEWAKYKIKSSDGQRLRSHLLPLLKYIRFLAMDLKEFCGNVVPSGILLKEEICEIIQSIGTEKILMNENLCKNKNHRFETDTETGNIITQFVEIPNGVSLISTINNINLLNSMEISAPIILCGFTWQLMVIKAMKDNINGLSAYIKCGNYRRGWPSPIEHTCCANITITLLNQSGQPDKHFTSQHTFNIIEDDWGWNGILVVDPEKGFVRGNKIVVHARIQVNN